MSLAEDQDPSPSREGLDRVIAALGGEWRVGSVTRLGGGVAAATHALTLHDPHGALRKLVLKRYPADDETPGLEWDRLACAKSVELPTPEPIALDRDGAWFGTPALLISALPGRVEMFPRDVDAWTRQLAEALAAIHRTDVGDEIPPVLLRPHLLAGWRLWDVEVDPRIAAGSAAIDTLQREAAGEPDVFCHDDYHPGNVLFEGELLTGVIDWSSARLAPASSDVAHCRADLAIAPGGDARDRFLAHYLAASGAPLPRLPLWDVLQGMNALQWSAGWIQAFADVGVTRSAEEIRAAVLQFLDDALARC